MIQMSPVLIECNYDLFATQIENFPMITVFFYSIFRLAHAVRAMLAFGIFITHGIACYVAIELTWNSYIVDRITNERRKVLWEYVLRTIIVLITCKHLENHRFCTEIADN